MAHEPFATYEETTLHDYLWKNKEFEKWIRAGYPVNETVCSIEVDNIVSIPREISNLRKVVRVSIENCPATQLPDELFDLQNLTYLYLVMMPNLESISSRIGNLRTLCKLEIINTGISKLPEELRTNRQLNSLIVSGNKLDTIPGGITLLPMLKTLVLSNNGMTELPIELVNSGIRELDITGNCFQYLKNLPRYAKVFADKYLEERLDCVDPDIIAAIRRGKASQKKMYRFYVEFVDDAIDTKPATTF